jgi:di/tricarboxylate transporter
MQAWLTTAVVVAMFVQMARGRSAAGAILGAVVFLWVSGVIDERQALAGFANPAPLTVAALYVVAKAVEQTGLLKPLVRLALGGQGASGLLRLLVPAAAASAFLNNTPIVAMLIPSVRRHAERVSVPPSRFLMPLSFGVILGGVVTTIGTSTTLVVSGLLEAAGEAPLGIFEVSHVGLPIALVGLIAVSLLAPRLLPDRESPRDRLEGAGADFGVRMEVDQDGPLEGVTVEDAGLRRLDGVFLIQIDRGREVIAPVSPATILRGGDSLFFVGEAKQAADLRVLPGLHSAEHPHLIDLETPAHRLVEVVVGERSSLLGRTPMEVGFRGHYDAAIVGIHRAGHPVMEKLGGVRLRLGDTLLLLAGEGFIERWREQPDFVFISMVEEEPAALSRAGLLAATITLGVVGVAGAGWVPILQAASVGAALLVATGVLSFREAYRAVDIEVLLVIAGAFGVGAAIEQSGLATLLGHGIVEATAGWGWRWGLLGIVLATLVLTEFISNNAAAALMFPIAFSTAQAVGADPRAFAIAVAMTASCSFLTPVGYQTNTMVYGPGGYRFGDYWRLGAPLTLAAVGTIVAMV